MTDGIRYQRVYDHLGLGATKPVFGVSGKARFKPVYSARKLKEATCIKGLICRPLEQKN